MSSPVPWTPSRTRTDIVFGIVAEFPLGKYVGHFDERVEPYPGPARLHAALLCAAAQGPSAVEENGTLAPDPADVDALRWLEEHPPTGVAIPRTAQRRQQRIAYRDMGLLQVKMKGTKKATKDAVRGTALQGVVGWSWDQDPPDDLRDRIAALCRDVPYLGSSESPVRLRVADVEPTHRVDPSATLFDVGGITLELPAPGRFAALTSSHAAHQGKVPTRARDRATVDESDIVPQRNDEAVLSARFCPIGRQAVPPRVPWDRVVVIEVRDQPDGHSAADSRHVPPPSPIPSEDRVAWCVALHRAVISVVGLGTSPTITGKWTGTPASNHVAIHLAEVTPAMGYGFATTLVFVVMIPHDADDDAVAQLVIALEHITVLRRRGSARRLSLSIASPMLPADDFWRPPDVGLTRAWTTVPAAVPDTRPIRSGGWSWSDTVALSVAMTWKDFLTPDVDGPRRSGVRRGDLRYVRLAEAVQDAGVEVLQATPITRGDPTKFVHRIAEGSLLRPYVATLLLGRLASDTTVSAVGQSRHLGAGLLVPLDLPDAVLDSWRLA